MKKLLAFLILAGSAAFVAWGIWVKLLGYVYTLIPAGEWAGLIKLVVTLFVAYFGGVAVPLFLVLCGIYLAVIL